MTQTDIARRVYNHAWKLDPIVRSLLDTDFYKLLMLQMIWGMYPDVDATFSLINRTKSVRLADEIDEGELRANLDHARSLRPTKKEMISAAAAGMVLSVGWIVVVAAALVFRGLPFTSNRQVQDILGVPLVATLREGDEYASGSLASLPMLTDSRRIVYLTSPDARQGSPHVCRMVANAFLDKDQEVTVFRISDTPQEESHRNKMAQFDIVDISTSKTDFRELKRKIEQFLNDHPRQNVLIDSTAISDLETKLALSRIADSAVVIVSENGITRGQVEQWFHRLKSEMKNVLALYQTQTFLPEEAPLALPEVTMADLVPQTA